MAIANTNIKTEMKKSEIAELHASTLEISKASFEIKKLCITTIGVFCGLFLTKLDFSKQDITLKNNLAILLVTLLVGFIIAILFHIIDTTTYYYQRKNRKIQTILKNEILLSNRLNPLPEPSLSLLSSIFNASQSMYFTLYSILLLLLSFIMISENLLLPTWFPKIMYLVFPFTIAVFIYLSFNKKNKYFISYTTKDGKINKEFLFIVKNHINKRHHCYVDLLDNDSIDKQSRVINELQKCTHFLLIKTPETTNSSWVNIEIDLAISLKKKTLEIDYISSYDQFILELNKKIS